MAHRFQVIVKKRETGNYWELRPIMQAKLRNSKELFTLLLSGNRSCMCEKNNTRHIHITKGWNIFTHFLTYTIQHSFISPHSLNTYCSDVMTYDHLTALPEQLTWYNSFWLWRWLPHRLLKRLSLSTTTGLFRTTFSRTIKLNLLLLNKPRTIRLQGFMSIRSFAKQMQSSFNKS